MTTSAPSPVDVLKRWPRAIMLLSALIIKGDSKHAGDGRTNFERGAKLDQGCYGVEYSDEKQLRHAARRFDGEEVDAEMEVTHLAAEAWHGLNKLQAYCEDNNLSVAEIINLHTHEVLSDEK